MTTDDDISRIGISLPENLRREFDEILTLRNYHSRSEGVRDAIRIYNHHHQWLVDAQCPRKGVFTMVYDYTDDDLLGNLDNIRTQYKDLVRVSLQTQVTKKRRLEVLLVEGEGTRLRELAERLHAQKGLESVKLTTTTGESTRTGRA
nr:nickel-responsive transcriptional regulator NikR [uncultured Methanoregula sp.]